MSETLEFYRKKHEEYTVQLDRLLSQLRRYVWYRLFAFAAIFLPVSILGLQWATAVLTFFVVAFFLGLVKRNILLENKKQKLSALKQIVEDELLALKHSFLHFSNGEEFLDTEHFFSYDLDLFGSGSLFQLLNRTATVGGKEKLAKDLISPSNERKVIEQKQKAVVELSENPDWRLQFLAAGKMFEEDAEVSAEIRSWAKREMELKRPNLLRWLIIVVPAITLIAAIPALLGISGFFLSLMVVLQLGIMFFNWSKTNSYFNFFCRKSELLAKYMELLRVFEEFEFKSEYLLSLQQKISNPSASKIFDELRGLVTQFEYRQNVIVGFALNSSLVWDIRCVYKLWLWHKTNRHRLVHWLDVIAEIDALVSLGNFANNHSSFVYPEIVDGEFCYHAKELGHPLLEAGKRVCNDFDLKGWSKVMIVTGANMAGKSTFLRTVGVNLILARLGAPVCAQHMAVSPIEMYTNMRTTDSLLKDESYFFAELKRIKGVLDRLENGERIFVILDEMLKGTNSLDKLNGSRELIKKLTAFKSVSLIATHDLKLSEMEEDYPQQIMNRCFEILIKNNELIFDYKLSAGVTQTMNATFLMKKMGII